LSAERKVFHSIPFHRKLPLYTALHQYPFLVQLFMSGTVYNRRCLLRLNLEALVRGSAQNLTPTAGSDHPRLNDKYFKICFRIGSLARELFGIVFELYSHRLIWLEVGCLTESTFLKIGLYLSCDPVNMSSGESQITGIRWKHRQLTPYDRSPNSSTTTQGAARENGALR
jgi:hypothetical protein